MVLTLMIAVGIYAILMIRSGAILREELPGIPKGDKIEKILDKLGLLQVADRRVARYRKRKAEREAKKAKNNKGK